MMTILRNTLFIFALMALYLIVFLGNIRQTDAVWIIYLHYNPVQDNPFPDYKLTAEYISTTQTRQELLVLPTVPADYLYASEMSLSPNGQRLAISYKDDAIQTGIYTTKLDIMQISGQQVTTMTEPFYEIQGLDWSPDNQELMLSMSGDGISPQVYILREDLTFKQITDSFPQGSASWKGDVQWALQDDWWFYIDGGLNRQYLTRMRPYSNQNQALIPLNLNISSFDLSPDGKWLCFSAYDLSVGRTAGNYNLYLMRVDGSDLTQLTNMLGDEFNPSWSPNGQWIVFSYRSADSVDEQADLYQVYFDGTHLEQLTDWEGLEIEPTWVSARSYHWHPRWLVGVNLVWIVLSLVWIAGRYIRSG